MQHKGRVQLEKGRIKCHQGREYMIKVYKSIEVGNIVTEQATKVEKLLRYGTSSR